MSIGFETRVKSSGEVISTEMDGEAVLMDVSRGIYYGLNSVAAVVWMQLTEPIAVVDVCSVVSEEFEVDPEVCRNDVIQLLKEFSDVGLVEVVEAES